MATSIIKNPKSITGYSLKLVNGDKTEIVDVPKISEPDKHGCRWLILPDNDANRKYMALPKAEKIEGELVLEYRETRTIGPRDGKKAEDYLTDDEKKSIEKHKAAIEKIMAEAKSRMDAEKNRELTPIEKKQREIEKLQRQIEELKRTEKEAEAKA